MWCVVPVAGRSSRFRGHTGGRPKALLDLHGRTLLGRLLDRLGPEFSRVCVVAAPDSLAAVRRSVGPRHGRLRVVYEEQPEPRGVADAVRCAAPRVRGAFVALMGDSYFDDQLDVLPARWRDSGAAGAVLVEPARGAGDQPAGLVAVEGGQVTQIYKDVWTGQTEWRVCGAYLLPETYFEAAAQVSPAASGELELESVVTRLLTDGAAFAAVPYSGWRRNINTPDDLAMVRERLTTARRDA